MSKWIDADAVIARIAGQMSYEIEVETGNETDCVDLAEELLNDIPSIDIEPKRGEWKNYKDEHYCTNCGEVVIGDWYDEDDWYNFCPNCGADMREVRDE